MCETENPQQLGTPEVHVFIQIPGPRQPGGPQLEDLVPRVTAAGPERSCSHP